MHRRRAHAKLNLALSVGPPEPAGSANAGMHPIASWMHSIALRDTIALTLLDGHQIPTVENHWTDDAPCPSPIDWPPEKDLAFRALRLLEQSSGRKLPIAVRIDKRVPVGGGLGGGSGNAAAVLDGVNQLCSLGLSAAALARLASELGSDVAFFLGDPPAAPALVQGMGDQIERLPRRFAEQPVILLFPPFGCPTAAVYKAYDSLGPQILRQGAVRDLAAAPTLDDSLLFNDLLAPALKVQPALESLLAAARKSAPHPVHMSGSGSTLFLLPPPGEETKIATKLRRELSDISVLVSRLV